MSALATLIQLRRYIGRPTNDCIDEITTLVKAHGCSIEIQDPEWNVGNIDKDPKRVNLIQDKNMVIHDFKVG